MYIPLWTTLLHAARHSGPALVHRTSSDGICLPFQLQTAIPSCAIQCLQMFIANNYNTQVCTSTADISFLCTNPTFSGLTIGEGSLQCVISSCIGADIQTQSGYTVCDGVVGAIPNMAGTITATVSAITTLFSSADTSSTATTTSPAAPSTSDPFSSTSASQDPGTSFADSTAPITSSTSSLVPSESLPPTSTIATLPSSSATSSSETFVSQSTRSSSRSSGTTSPSANSSSSSVTRTFSSSTSTTETATNSPTAAAATEGPSKSELSPGAIAGIATAAAVVLALILGYLAYWFYVKRQRRNRRSQRPSTFFKPPAGGGSAGPTLPAIPEISQDGFFSDPSRRFYTGELSQDNRRSPWRRSALPPSDIGVAVAASTRVSPDRRVDTQAPSETGTSQQPPGLTIQIDRSRPNIQNSQWSPAMSLEDDIEAQGQAQNQDLPALASPKTRASSRSFSSAGVVEKPAPLRLSRIKTRPGLPKPDIMPLTPVYDNGTFEPTIRQVIQGPDQTAGIVGLSQDRQAPNFSRREPSLTRTSQDDARPSAFQARQPGQFGRFPVKPSGSSRKQSNDTDRTGSIYTDIDEDSTPEEENDKQLKAPQPPFPTRIPLRDIQYPQIPRNAATSSQAEKPHSPRALTIRQVPPDRDPSPQQPGLTARAQMIKTGRNFALTNKSSSSDLGSQDSGSPIFPTPPMRKPGQNGPRQELRLQIVDAYRAAARPVTTASSATNSTRQDIGFPPSAYPRNSRFGQEYDSPSLQRLSTGRPLAQRLQQQGYMPRPPMTREAPQTRVRPLDPRSGDLYFTLDSVGR